MRVAIVDDEPLARRGVRARLSQIPGIDLVAECQDGREAVTLIREQRLDLIFLDIQMPDLDGFEGLRQLSPGERPLVIFLTAYQKHALAAFDAHAVDYLLKPIDDERFHRALERARLLLTSQDLAGIQERVSNLLRATQASGEAGKYRTHLTAKTGRRATVIALADVNWISADGDYITLHVGGKSHLVRQTIGSLAAELNPEEFIRIHRSTIVRKSQIAELTTLESGGLLIRLRDGETVRTSRSYSQRLTRCL